MYLEWGYDMTQISNGFVFGTKIDQTGWILDSIEQ